MENTTGNKLDLSIEHSLFGTLFFWVLVTTWNIAPLNPPEWANNDVIYLMWWVLVAWAVLICAMTPAGIVVIFTTILFRRRTALFLCFCSLWIFDTLTRKYIPMVEVTPGYALSLLYVYVIWNKSGRVLL